MHCFRIFTCYGAGTKTDTAPVGNVPVLPRVSSELPDPELAILGRPRVPLSPRENPNIELFPEAAGGAKIGTKVAPAVSDPVLRSVSLSDLLDPELAMLGRPRIPLNAGQNPAT